MDSEAAQQLDWDKHALGAGYHCCSLGDSDNYIRTVGPSACCKQGDGTSSRRTWRFTEWRPGYAPWQFENRWRATISELSVSHPRASMKILRFLLVIVATLAIAIAVSRRTTAQPTNSTDDRGVLGQYEQLVLSLSKRGDTNTATQVSSLVSAMHAGRDATSRRQFGFWRVCVRDAQTMRSGYWRPD